MSGIFQKAHQRTKWHDALQASVEMLTGTTSYLCWRRKPGRPQNSWLHDVLKDMQLTAHMRPGQQLMMVYGGEHNSPLHSYDEYDDDDDVTAY